MQWKSTSGTIFYLAFHNIKIAFPTLFVPYISTLSVKKDSGLFFLSASNHSKRNRLVSVESIATYGILERVSLIIWRFLGTKQNYVWISSGMDACFCICPIALPVGLTNFSQSPNYQFFCRLVKQYVNQKQTARMSEEKKSKIICILEPTNYL